MKSTGRIILVFIVFALVPLGIHLFAQSQRSSNSATPASDGIDWMGFQRQLDADRDGFVTQEEWDRVFTKRDENGDKRLSSEELESFSGMDMEALDSGRMAAFQRLDKNRNDVIDFSEWPGKKNDFLFLDVDRDNSLSREEFTAKNAMWWNELFENLDFDGNRVITRSEWLDSRASFDRLDRDHNGIIEKREFYNPR